jgi:hypothetical protein
MTHPNDVRITNPKWVELLSKDDVVLLPLWGMGRVMDEPSYLPGSNRTIVVLNVMTTKGHKRLLCSKHMPLQYEGFSAD